ncbi:MAG: hypothetical protein AAFY49_12760 [Pseudomonadota bacterium]
MTLGLGVRDMRATMFAVGLTLASTAALAQAQNFTTPPANKHITLTNGCVYTPNELTGGNEWSLIYTQAGTTVQCPLTIYGQSAEAEADPLPVPEPAAVYIPETPVYDAPAPIVTRTQNTPFYRPKPRPVFKPGFLVGVFR